MAVTGQPTTYSIPIHRAVADALAAGVIARFDDGALGLAQGLILLPSNRARSAVPISMNRSRWRLMRSTTIRCRLPSIRCTGACCSPS